MSTKLAHAAPVVIVATIAAALSISIATANPAGAEPHQIPVYTSHQTLNGYADVRFDHAGWPRAITDPNKIYPGQVIKIPKSSQTYVVKRGDTFSGIAKKLGVSLAALEAANRK
jgi:nucleoid-associated protein YgaU